MPTDYNKRFRGEGAHFDISVTTKTGHQVCNLYSAWHGVRPRILDLKDEMVTFNRKSGLGKCIETPL